MLLGLLKFAKLPRLKLVRGRSPLGRVVEGDAGAEGAAPLWLVLFFSCVDGDAGDGCGALACSASERRNSTKRFENDSSPVDEALDSAALRPCPPLFPSLLMPMPTILPGLVVVEDPMLVRCSPAVSLSSSDHCKTLAMRESISKRFPSARGVVRNCRSRFVTSLRSTLTSDVFARSRRNASVKCSFRMTASWRSLPINKFFSLTSFSRTWHLSAAPLNSAASASAAAVRV